MSIVDLVHSRAHSFQWKPKILSFFHFPSNPYWFKPYIRQSKSHIRQSTA